MVVPRFSPHIGGVEIHAASLARRIAASGWSVTVLTPEIRSDLTRVEHVDGYEIRRFPIDNRSVAFPVSLALWRWIRHNRQRLDLVHAHSFHAVTALGCTWASDLPLVFTPHYHAVGHTFFARLLHLPYDRLAGRIFEKSTRVICVSSAEESLLRRDYPEAGPKIRVIHNGTDVAELITTTRYESVKAPSVLVACRLESYKRADVVIRAAARLPKQPNLIVVGSGPMRERLERLAHDAGVKVTFLGNLPTEELRRWQRTVDVVASASDREAFGLTLVEGAVGGARLVASDISAHREVRQIVGPEVMSLVPPGDIDAFSHALSSALDAGRHGGIVDVPTWDRAATQTIACYNGALRAA